MRQTDIPVAPGCYLLLLHLPRHAVITVGKLGEHGFASGYYAYIGSAFGPGGLRARLGRHLSADKRSRWHIDYLRPRCKPMAASWVVEARIEHLWALQLLADPAVAVPMPRFGSSDCNCPAHLTYWGRTRPATQRLRYADATRGC